MRLTKLSAIHWWGEACLKYAAEDLARDLLTVTGKSLPVICSHTTGAGILSVGTVREEAYLSNAGAYFPSLPRKWEEYKVAVLSDRIVILGTDKRAAMWGVYALSQKLGVLPLCRYSLDTPNRKETLDEEIFGDFPKTCRFRGWFINDEDLLTKRIISGGKRDYDYAFYQDVCDVKSMEEAVETALRLGINMIIPGSVIDIDEPYQEALVEYCVKRGLYVTQHHVEPVGVSWWGYNNYHKKHGEVPPYSYVSQKEKFVEVWRYYIKKWAKYGTDVIWQLGLRGKGNSAIWDADGAQLDKQAWGEIISDAIRTQHEIIREEVGEAFFSTTTLWAENSQLYMQGSLQIPEGVIHVFSDEGPTQMMASDFYNIPRSSGVQTGIYYHAAYWGAGPHLALGNNPEKMLWNYDLAFQKGDREYSILNVANAREVIYSAAVNSRILWDRDSFDLGDFNSCFAKDYFGNEALSTFFPRYFDAFIAGSVQDFTEHRKKVLDAVVMDVPFPYYAVNDGDLRLFGMYTLRGDDIPGKNWIHRLEESRRKFAELLEESQNLSHKPYFEEYLFAIQYLIWLEGWLLELLRYKDSGDKVHLERAAENLSEYIQKRVCMEHGPWENWYRGEDKMCLEMHLKNTLALLNKA